MGDFILLQVALAWYFVPPWTGIQTMGSSEEDGSATGADAGGLAGVKSLGKAQPV